MKKQSIITFIILVIICSITIAAFATQDKVLQIFKNGEVIQEYNLADIDYIEINDESDESFSKTALLESAIDSMTSFMNTRNVCRSGQATDFAYPSQMIIRDVMGQDMIQVYNNYQHFYSFQQISIAINEDYHLNQIVWYYYNLQVKAANDVISMINPDTASDKTHKLLGQALAYRAFIYLDMARLYEYLPNHHNSPINKHGNDVTRLTVPIITTPRHPADSVNTVNITRATHKQMFDFILSDLDEAQNCFKANNARENLTRPDLSVVYGLKARLYMWDENYPKAAEFAKLAQAGYTPLSESEWNDPINGFNSMTTQNSWMFAIHQNNEDDCVQSYSNWASFMCSEGESGYGAKFNNPMVCDMSLYRQINDHDFRKLSWKAPSGSSLSGRETLSNPYSNANLTELASLKFRPARGASFNNWAVDIPLMRVEEMFLIEAEAVAHTNPEQGKQLLESFMQTYRYPQYTCYATTAEDIINEIFLQKRIEFWGEGIICFDFKRLNKSVIRSYEGTNWPATARFNTDGRPAWLNFVMCSYEGELNPACYGWNNPDVGGTYLPTDTLATSNGVYFPNSTPTTVTLTKNQTEFTLKILRSNSDEALEVPISATISSEYATIFTVPSTVTFAAGQNEADITISVDFNSIVDGKDYKIGLEISRPYASTYSLSQLELNVLYNTWSRLGKGVYTYNSVVTGNEETIIDMRTSPDNPNVLQYRINNLSLLGYMEYNMLIEYDNSTGYVTVPVTDCVTTSGGSAINCGDVYTFGTQIKPSFIDGIDPEKVKKMAGEYDADTGRFTLNMVYWNAGLSNYSGNNHEYLQLPGFPNQYDVKVSLNGKNTPTTQVFNIVMSNALSSVKYQIYEGTLSKANAYAKAGSLVTDDKATSVKASGNVAIELTNGDYTIVVAGVDASGELKVWDYLTFNFIVDSNEDWISEQGQYGDSKGDFQVNFAPEEEEEAPASYSSKTFTNQVKASVNNHLNTNHANRNYKSMTIDNKTRFNYKANKNTVDYISL